MKTRKLGNQGLEVSELGLGCMGMSEFYGKADEQESIRTLHKALELGVNFIDTADTYGIGENEKLLQKQWADFETAVFEVVRKTCPDNACEVEHALSGWRKSGCFGSGGCQLPVTLMSLSSELRSIRTLYGSAPA